jgi:FlaG/FlaF family flagellin (archaellin)
VLQDLGNVEMAEHNLPQRTTSRVSTSAGSKVIMLKAHHAAVVGLARTDVRDVAYSMHTTCSCKCLTTQGHWTFESYTKQKILEELFCQTV